MSRVAFDIDGIVLDTPREMWNVFTSHFDLPWSIDAWKEYYIEKQLGIPQANLRPLYEPILSRVDLPFIKGASKALRNFYRYTKEPILFITARRPQFVSSARASLERELKDIPIEIVATSDPDSKVGDKSGHHKTDFLLEHAIEFFVDDHPHSWDDYIEAGVCVATLDWPWTREKGLRLEKEQNDDNGRWFRMYRDWDELDSSLHTIITGRSYDDYE
jgi:uncharacterized HAD superfamily protein